MSAPERILIDGEPQDRLSVLDRGLQFGDGLFETIACRNGRPRLLALHLDRLARGCDRLEIKRPDPLVLRNEIEAMAQGADAIVKLIVTRGEAVARGYAWAGNERVTRVLMRFAWASAEVKESAHIGTAAVRLGENPALAGVKHLNRLEQVLAQGELRRRGLDELLMLSSSGRLVSGTMSNVFIVHDGKLLTPRIDRCGVAGIMRQVVLREARRAAIPVEEAQLGARHLKQGQEIFLTNARLGIWPVRALGTRELSPGPVTARLQALLQPLLEAPADA